MDAKQWQMTLLSQVNHRMRKYNSFYINQKDKNIFLEITQIFLVEK